MHESSLVRGLISQIETIVRDKGGGTVTSVSIRVGTLMVLSDEHLQATFATLTAGSPLEGARLNLSWARRIDTAEAQELLIESIEVMD